MKKNIILIIIAFAFFAMSCEKEHKIEFYDLGTEIYISSSGMTTLDNQAVVTVENPLQNLTSVSVTHLGTVDPDDEDETMIAPPSSDLGSVSFSGGEGSVIYNETQLDISVLGWTAYLQVDGDINGKAFTRPYHITVESPFSTEDPGITHRADTAYYFKYDVEPATATVSNVTIETKVNSDGIYATKVGSWNASDSVGFVGADYNIGDTIFVRITATAGAKSDVEVAELIISPYSLENAGAFVLKSDLKPYDLIEGESVVNDGDYADIYAYMALTVPDQGESYYALISDYNTVFVEGTATDYANGDIYDVTTIDYSLAPGVTGNIALGDVFFFRTFRDAALTKYFYGIMKVTGINVIDGDHEKYEISVEYKY